MAAIGNVRRFTSPQKLVQAGRLAPVPSWLRQPGPRPKRQARYARFFLRIRAHRGHEIAAVAVARKLAVFCWHLLTKGADYQWAMTVITAATTEAARAKLDDYRSYAMSAGKARWCLGCHQLPAHIAARRRGHDVGSRRSRSFREDASPYVIPTRASCPGGKQSLLMPRVRGSREAACVFQGSRSATLPISRIPRCRRRERCSRSTCQAAELVVSHY